MATVKVRKSCIDYFRRLARHTNLEIQAYLIGQVESPDKIRVDSLEYTRQYARQTTMCVAWTGEEYSRILRKADDHNKRNRWFYPLPS